MYSKSGITKFRNCCQCNDCGCYLDHGEKCDCWQSEFIEYGTGNREGQDKHDGNKLVPV